jgi:response regulator NasT
MTIKSPAKPIILLVDDDRLILTTLAQGLKFAGYSVWTAESVDEAEALLASGERPDLVVLDINMPGRSGLELAERLNAFDHIPFMLLTAYSDAELVEQAVGSGALSYLVKPVDTVQLEPAIKAALARATELRDIKIVKQQLQTALDSERNISIAIGITMMQYQLERKAAYEKLRKAARSQRIKLADIANKVIDANEILNVRSPTELN